MPMDAIGLVSLVVGLVLLARKQKVAGAFCVGLGLGTIVTIVVGFVALGLI